MIVASFPFRSGSLEAPSGNDYPRLNGACRSTRRNLKLKQCKSAQSADVLLSLLSASQNSFCNGPDVQCRLLADSVENAFLADERNSLAPLIRFARRDVRDYSGGNF